MMQFETGQLTGTGSDIDVNLGYKPSYVKVINLTTPEAMEWYEGMADDAAVDYPSASGSANISKITTDGITILDKSDVSDPGGSPDGPVTVTGTVGFQIPAAFQSDTDELYYIAGRH